MKNTYSNLYEQVFCEYGDPFTITASASIGTVNTLFFAAFFSKRYPVIYCIPEGKFYLYDKESGIWKSIYIKLLLERIGRFFAVFENEFYAYGLAAKANVRIVKEVADFLMGILGCDEEAFGNSYQGPPFIHTLNCMPVWHSDKARWEVEDFSPDFFSRNQIPIVYDPHATCPRFLNDLLRKAMSQSDIFILQQYVGQCLLRKNYSQRFLLLTGMPGAGKSTLLNIIENLLGVANVTELRVEHFNSRFETNRFRGRSLLTVKDAAHDFLNQKRSGKIKSLTGGDRLSTEQKSKNEFYDIVGEFNIITTMNSTPVLYVKGDADAWKRRALWISYERPPVKDKIVGFDKILIKEEGAGILNWALKGAGIILKNGGLIQLTPEQNSRIDMLMAYSQSFEVFAERYIHPEPKAYLTTNELVTAYMRFCHQIGCPSISERAAQQALKQHIGEKYGATIRKDIKVGNTYRRGYLGFQIRTIQEVNNEN